MAYTPRGPQPVASTPTPRVVVVGAGIAGLAAAARLIQRGVESVTVLEAADRVGGRIQTIHSDSGSSIELGAEWIHGIQGNPVFKLARKNDLLSNKKGGKSKTTARYRKLALTEDGNIVDSNVVREVFGHYYFACNKARDYFHENQSGKDDSSLGRFITEELENWLLSFPPEERSIRRAVLNHRFRWENCEFGTDHIDDLSLNMFGSYETPKGANLTVPGGFSGIIEALRAQVPSEGVLLNHVVTLIDYHHYEKTATDQQYPCRIACANGATFLADVVIVTISLGCLKAGVKTLFSPRLPEWKEAAIMDWGFGIVNKIFLSFENLDFLPPKVDNIQFIWKEEPGRDEDNSGSQWFKNITNMNIYSKSKTPMLIAWVSGKAAQHMEKLTNTQVRDDCHRLLSSVLKSDVPVPTRIIRSSWSSNSYTKGSYSYAPVGSSPGVLKDLAHPIYHPLTKKPLLLFAGEATHPKFYSTTHGALLTGQAQSDIILESL